jgi:hypothetical protein
VDPRDILNALENRKILPLTGIEPWPSCNNTQCVTENDKNIQCEHMGPPTEKQMQNPGNEYEVFDRNRGKMKGQNQKLKFQRGWTSKFVCQKRYDCNSLNI